MRKKLRMAIGISLLGCWTVTFLSIFVILIVAGLQTWNFLWWLMAALVFFLDWFTGSYFHTRVVEWVEK